MIRRLLIALVCVLSLGMVLAMARRNHPQDQRYARALLFRADAAQDQIPHTGILVTASYLGARPLITEARVACAGEERSRIEYLTPPMRGLLILDDGVRSWRYDPQRGILYAECHCRTFEERRRRNLALLLRNYQPRFHGEATVAARPALRLTLCSNYGGRVAKRLWMDSDTALVLRSEAFHPNGALLSRTAYREVNFR
ncbi:MAG TPA: sigma-E factor regulatory protein RseB domain-containing protein, partial [Armatimonadota bacterium]|nr:sigma-E factor regulatory protein RseB domain-containing protein [Armatimonadota bacterium]